MTTTSNSPNSKSGICKLVWSKSKKNTQKAQNYMIIEATSDVHDNYV